MIVTVHEDKKVFHKVFEKVIRSGRGNLRKTLTVRGNMMVNEIKNMWEKVDYCLGIRKR